MLSLRFIVLFVCLLWAPVSLAKPYVEGGVATVAIDELFVTQFVVGMQEVEVRKQLIRTSKGHSTKAPQGLYQDKTGRMIVGPGGKLYLIDGHHLARALHDLSHKEMYVIVEHDWSHMSPKQFWKEMEKNDYCYLYDEKGEKQSYKKLPKSIGKLRDDPYRSLAWFVRKAGAFKNLGTPFQEFVWAEIFREMYPGLTNDPDTFLKIAKKAIKFARSKKAKKLDLPGFIKKKKQKMSCNEIFDTLSALLPADF